LLSVIVVPAPQGGPTQAYRKDTWIEWSNMAVDLERRYYLHAEAKLKPEETV
jgi:hypothetical protein